LSKACFTTWLIHFSFSANILNSEFNPRHLERDLVSAYLAGLIRLVVVARLLAPILIDRHGSNRGYRPQRADHWRPGRFHHPNKIQ
jgi:hypothetical protein